MSKGITRPDNTHSVLPNGRSTQHLVAFALYQQAIKADKDKQLIKAFWLYRHTASDILKVLSEQPGLKHFAVSADFTAQDLLKTSSSRALDLQRMLNIEVPASEEAQAARKIAQRLISSHSWLPTELPQDFNAITVKNRLDSTTEWVSALVVGPAASTDCVIAALSAHSATAGVVVETADVDSLISAATAESDRCRPRLLIAELMQRPGLLCLRQLDRLFSDNSGVARTSSELVAELLVRVHALRFESGRGVRVCRSRLLVTAVSRDSIPPSARRRLFDLQLDC